MSRDRGMPGAARLTGLVGKRRASVLVLTVGLVTSAASVAQADARSSNGGRVVAWGHNDYGQTSVPAGLTNVVAVAAGANHALALRSDGTVVAWGAGSESKGADPNGRDFDFGQTDVPDGLRDVVAIAAGPGFSAAVRRDGSVEVWPKGRLCGAQPPLGLSRIVSLAAGEDHLVGLREDGTVAAWGHTAYSETQVPPGLLNVRAIAAGGARSWALRHDGSIVGWGEGYNYGYPIYPDVREQVYRCDVHPPVSSITVPDTLANISSDSALGSDVTSIAAGRYSLVRRHADGTLSSSGNDWCPLTLPTTLTGVDSVAVGQGASRPHGLALKSDGTVASWNCRGKLRPVPENLRQVIAIAAGGDFDLAITTD